MPLPNARGPLTEELFGALRAGLGDFHTALAETPAATGEDAALALWVLYELHYRGFDEVDDDFEWDPELLRLRACWSATSRHGCARGSPPPDGADVRRRLLRLDRRAGRPLARPPRAPRRDPEQVLELLRIRSIYHLKESDPVAWVVPRLGVRAKAALMELQYDEYGAGDPNRLHHHLFARGHGGQRARADVRRAHRRGAVRGRSSRTTRCRFRAAPPAPRRRARPPRGVRGDQLAAVAPDGRRAWSGSASPRRWSPTTPSTSRPTPSTSSSRSARSAAALLEDEPELEPDVWFGAFTCLDLEDRFARPMLAGGASRSSAA